MTQTGSCWVVKGKFSVRMYWQCDRRQPIASEPLTVSGWATRGGTISLYLCTMYKPPFQFNDQSSVSSVELKWVVSSNRSLSMLPQYSSAMTSITDQHHSLFKHRTRPDNLQTSDVLSTMGWGAPWLVWCVTQSRAVHVNLWHYPPYHTKILRHQHHRTSNAFPKLIDLLCCSFQCQTLEIKL